MKKIIILTVLLLCLCLPVQADSYVYSNEQALNIYYECEDFDGVIPDSLDGAFDSRIASGDEVLCGTRRVMKYHNDPGVAQGEDALLALKRDGRILLLGAKRTDGVWRCAIETDSFFAPGQQFDLTVLPQPGEGGQMRGASLAIVCGAEEFLVSVQEDGSLALAAYCVPWADGSTLNISVSMGFLHAQRTLDGILQESRSASGVIAKRLCGWTYDIFPKSCAEVAAWEGRGVTPLGEDEVFVFGVNFREQPTGNSRSMGKYTAKARVIGREPGQMTSWYQVRIGDTVGWVSGTYVLWPQNERDSAAIVEYLSKMPYFAKTRREAGRHVMLRSEPDGEAVMQLPAGTVMQVISENEGWLHVILPEDDGWAFDWDGLYGYVRADDVITGASPADIQYQ